MLTDVDDILKEFNKELVKAIQAVMISRGLKKDSDVVKTVEIKGINEGFTMIANDYYKWVDTGRRPRVRKVPIKDLIKWMKDKRIRTRNMNATAFAIQTSIFKHGIKGKKYADEVEDVVADLTEIRIADGLEESLADALVETFKI